MEADERDIVALPPVGEIAASAPAPAPPSLFDVTDSVLAAMCAIDTEGAWLLDEAFAERLSAALGVEATREDLARAFRTAAGGVINDDQFLLLRTKLGVPHEDGGARYASAAAARDAPPRPALRICSRRFSECSRR